MHLPNYISKFNDTFTGTIQKRQPIPVSRFTQYVCVCLLTEKLDQWKGQTTFIVP